MTQKNILRWGGLLAIIVIIFCLTFQTTFPEWNQDLGRHLRLGEMIVKNKTIPQTNLFSYTQTDFNFDNHHWLSEVVFYLIYQTGGNNALIWFKVLVLSLTWGILFCLSDKKTPLTWILLIAIIPILVFRERTDVRPEIFGLLFLSCYLWFYERFKQSGKQYWLILIAVGQVFWVNFHISFVFGLLLLGVYFLEQLLVYRKNKNKKNLTSLFLLILAMGSSLVNPQGVKGALSPFLIWQNYGYEIAENQSIFYLSSIAYQANIVFLLIGLVIGITLFAVIRKEIWGFLIWSVLSILAVLQIRHFSTWAIYSFYYWSKLLVYLYPKISSRILVWSKNIAGVIFGLFWIWIISFYPTGFYYHLFNSGRQFGLGGEEPARLASEFLLTNFSQEKIFNNFDIGSYLDYFYPQIKTFADSRPEAFANDFWEVYRQAGNNWQSWQELVDEYQIEVAFISHTDQTPWAKQLLTNLYQSQEWSLVYLDGTIAIFTNQASWSNININQEFLADFATDSSALTNLGQFLILTGQDKQAQNALEMALEINPHSYRANYYLASLYLSSGNPALKFKAQNLSDKTKSWYYRL